MIATLRISKRPTGLITSVTIVAIGLVSVALAEECIDKAVDDPNDQNITYAADCSASSACQGTPVPGTCSGTYRPKAKICTTGGTQFCVGSQKIVMLKKFSGTCRKDENDHCSCLDKIDVPSGPEGNGVETYISDCVCVGC